MNLTGELLTPFFAFQNFDLIIRERFDLEAASKPSYPFSSSWHGHIQQEGEGEGGFIARDIQQKEACLLQNNAATGC